MGAKASQIIELIANWLTENMHPLSVIGDSGFKRRSFEDSLDLPHQG